MHVLQIDGPVPETRSVSDEDDTARLERAVADISL
jgi:hypothetical protein